MTYRRTMGSDIAPTPAMPAPPGAPFIPTTIFQHAAMPAVWAEGLGPGGAIYSPHGWGPEMRPYYERPVFPGGGAFAPEPVWPLGEAPSFAERYVAPMALGAALGAIWALARGQKKDELLRTGALGAGVGLVTAVLIQMRGTRSVRLGERA
jgi:hypothetical protein